MRYVLIGVSAAGLAAAETLRQWAPQARITLVGEESHRPYSRPLLTYLLGGDIQPRQLWLKSEDYFREWGFEARLGEPVAGVDPQGKEVRLAGGGAIPFDRLLIATGAQVRRLGLPGEDLAGVHTLRHLADAQRLERELSPGSTVAVVGGGPVGLKLAEALIRRGHRVILAEAESRVLPRLLDDTAADMAHRALTDMGVDLRLNCRPGAIKGTDGRVRGLALGDGSELPVDAVILAVGVAPRVDFLLGSGLAEAEGILVDARMQTAHPDIFAAGDCAVTQHLITGEPAASGIWPAAAAQGKVAGANLAGASRRYPGFLPQNSISLPGLKIISGGLTHPRGENGEVVAQIDPQSGDYRRLVIDGGCLAGVTLAGRVNNAGLYFQLIANKTPLRELPADIRSRDFQPGRLWSRE